MHVFATLNPISCKTLWSRMRRAATAFFNLRSTPEEYISRSVPFHLGDYVIPYPRFWSRGVACNILFAGSLGYKVLLTLITPPLPAPPPTPQSTVIRSCFVGTVFALSWFHNKRGKVTHGYRLVITHFLYMLTQGGGYYSERAVTLHVVWQPCYPLSLKSFLARSNSMCICLPWHHFWMNVS